MDTTVTTANNNFLHLDDLITNSADVSYAPSFSLSIVTTHPLPIPIKFTSIYDQAFTPPPAKRARKNAVTAETLELRVASASKKKSLRALEKALKKSTKSLI